MVVEGELTWCVKYIAKTQWHGGNALLFNNSTFGNAFDFEVVESLDVYALVGFKCTRRKNTATKAKENQSKAAHGEMPVRNGRSQNCSALPTVKIFIFEFDDLNEHITLSAVDTIIERFWR